MAAVYNAPGKFPQPYLNDCKAEDPMMERVPMDRMDIGARAPGMPKQGEVTSGDMNLVHVGNGTGKS